MNFSCRDFCFGFFTWPETQPSHLLISEMLKVARELATFDGFPLNYFPPSWRRFSKKNLFSLFSFHYSFRPLRLENKKKLKRMLPFAPGHSS